MFQLFSTNLFKKQDSLKNPGRLLTDSKNEMAQASKICLYLLLRILANIVAALEENFWLVSDIFREIALLKLPNLISHL